LKPNLVVSLACAQYKTLVLLADGNIYEFPRGGLPRRLEMPERASGQVVKIAAGKSHFVAITSHMAWNVYTWGSSSEVSKEILGREIWKDRPESSAQTPAVVQDLPGRVSQYLPCPRCPELSNLTKNVNRSLMWFVEHHLPFVKVPLVIFGHLVLEIVLLVPKFKVILVVWLVEYYFLPFYNRHQIYT
jgi:alpha-tubulin suppressor-like RCC1 family protein